MNTLDFPVTSTIIIIKGYEVESSKENIASLRRVYMYVYLKNGEILL